MFKVIFVLMVMTGSLAIPANAQTSSEFGYQLHPEKLLENTVGDLQIYVISNGMMVPKIIKNLKIVSSDTNIIEILEVKESGYTNTIKIKANNPGVVTMALAAQGFASKEITLEVFNNNNYPTQMMMKITPDKFSIDGQRTGFVSISLATTGGLPTLAQEDTIVEIGTPNSDIIQLKDSELLIKKGEYFAITEFELLKSGNARIFASVDGMKRVSGTLEILEPTGPLEIQLTVIPGIYNSFSSATGYAIVQLLDSERKPVLAEEDITLKLGVENPDISVNTSHDFEEVVFDKKTLVIKKGEYSAFTKFSPRPNLSDFTDDGEQDFEMFVSVDNYLAKGDSFKVLHDEDGGDLDGEGPAIIETIPFLTTGKKEMVGVVYFETEIEVSRKIPNSKSVREFVTVTVPVTAKANYELGVSSSESNSMVGENAVMLKGENAVIIYGNTGTIAPDADSRMELYVTDNDGVKSAVIEPYGPLEDDIKLKMEPLVSAILVGKEFPIVSYLDESVGSAGDLEVVAVDDDDEEDPRNGPTLFVSDGFITFATNDFVDIEPIQIKKNQEYALTYPTINEIGTVDIDAQIGKIKGSVSINSQTTDPAIIHLGVIDNLLMNSNSLVTLQLLDSAGNPVYAKKDIKIELVSNNESILKTLEQITIKEGEYFHTFELETLKEGTIELALLSEDLPLSKYEINVIDISPVLSLNLLGGLTWNERIEAKLSVTIPEIETSLDGFQIEWETNGGEVKTMDSETNSEGIATLNIIANDKDKVSISATVTGNGLGASSISKTVDILNMPVIEETTSEVSTDTGLDMGTLLLIIIPVAIGGTLFFLKRIDKLDLITDRIPIGDKVEEIKEKIMDIRNR